MTLKIVFKIFLLSWNCLWGSQEHLTCFPRPEVKAPSGFDVHNDDSCHDCFISYRRGSPKYCAQTSILEKEKRKNNQWGWGQEQSGERRPTSLRPETIPFASTLFGLSLSFKKLLNAWLLSPLLPSFAVPLNVLALFPPPSLVLYNPRLWKMERRGEGS